MKTFEEKFTAWLDGSLGSEELRSFENENPSFQQEKIEFLKLKSLLKENLCGRELENPHFFTSQIMEKIRGEAVPKRRPARSFFGLPRLAWGGICALSVGFALFFTMIPRGDLSDPHAKYVAEVLKARTADPKMKATVDRKDAATIKLEALEKLPPRQDLHH
jgi:hypothetical protein